MSSFKAYRFEVFENLMEMEKWREVNPNCIPDEKPFRYGAKIVFDGVVRNHNEGKKVACLYYEGYKEMVLKEGEMILNEAYEKFDVFSLSTFHRLGVLTLGEIAVKVIVFSSHRKSGFETVQFVMNQIKKRLPIWKKETYIDGSAEWVYCDHVHP